MGSGGPSTIAIVRKLTDITLPKKVHPNASDRLPLPKAMSSTASATLATWFKIKGVNYSISSACATSNHCGNGADLSSGASRTWFLPAVPEELSWTMSNLFDAMSAMSSKYNDTPQKASRAYDKDRDGFVIAGGAGVLVLEELDMPKRAALKSMPGRRLWRHLRRLRHDQRHQVRVPCAA